MLIIIFFDRSTNLIQSTIVTTIKNHLSPTRNRHPIPILQNPLMQIKNLNLPIRSLIILKGRKTTRIRNTKTRKKIIPIVNIRRINTLKYLLKKPLRNLKWKWMGQLRWSLNRRRTSIIRMTTFLLWVIKFFFLLFGNCNNGLFKF